MVGELHSLHEMGWVEVVVEVEVAAGGLSMFVCVLALVTNGAEVEVEVE